jgi:hypothetical protein
VSVVIGECRSDSQSFTVEAVQNPWLDVDGADGDWRHPDDRVMVREPVRMPPQPWLGSHHDGRVCWLLGGFGTGDDMAYDDAANRPILDDWARRNLTGDPPNVWLDPDPAYAPIAHSRDVQWWLRATKRLRSALGDDNAGRHLLASRLFVLEAYPYPQRTNPRRRLPTHAYTAHLLDTWLASGRPVVVARGERGWTELVPALRVALEDGRAMRARSVQAATITPGNLDAGDRGFQEIVAALTAQQP